MPPLPSYQVKQSPRAKHLRLKVTPQEGLCVVVPRGFDEGKIPAILKRKKDWIADALEMAKERRRFFEQQPAHHLPERMELCAIGETWAIDYRVSDAKRGLRLRAEQGQVIVTSASILREDVIA